MAVDALEATPAAEGEGSGELSKLCKAFGIKVSEGLTPMTAIACRLKDLQDQATSKGAAEGADKSDAERYEWIRQPSNLNCAMFEFKGNTAEQVDAYIDRQIGRQRLDGTHQPAQPGGEA